MRFVLDASITLAWILPGQNTTRTDAVISALMRNSAVTPMIWHYDVASVLARSLRASILTAGEVDNFLRDLAPSTSNLLAS